MPDSNTLKGAAESGSDALTCSAVIVMKIGEYPPKQATQTAELLLRCYRDGGIPCNAMKLFCDRQGRRAFEVEDLFYALQVGLEAKRWEPNA